MKLSIHMNQKLNIEGLKRQYGRLSLLVGLLCGVMALLYMGFWFGDSALNSRKLLIAQQQQRLDNLYTQTDEQLQQINFLRVELEIERQAAVHVQQQLKQLHEQNHELQKQLSFYQKIMAPELQAGGLEIDQFTITSTAAKRIFHYKLVLVQTKKNKRYAKGYVQMSFQGTQGEQTAQYELADINAQQGVNKLPFSFQYFQILEGDIVLPEQFEPQQISISVILPTGKWQKFERLDRQFAFEVKDPQE